jgi:hypothetical protein
MDKFIKQRYSTFGNKYKRGFEQSQKRIDDLRHLVVESQLPAYYRGETVGSEEYFIDRVNFPTDYLFVVSVLAHIKYDCAGILEDLYNVNTERYYYKISIAPPENCKGCQIQSISTGSGQTTGDPYFTLEQLLDATTYLGIGAIPILTVADSATTQYLGINTNTSQLYNPVDLNHIYLAFGAQTSVGVLWTDPTETLSDVTVTYASYAFQTTTSKREVLEAATGILEKNIVCKYIHQDDIYAILEDPFNTTKYTSPKYTVAENYIDVHTDTIFIVDYVRLKYVRLPKRMNLALGVGCELPLHTHQEIVEMAIKSILEGIESQRYNSQTMEVIDSE